MKFHIGNLEIEIEDRDKPITSMADITMADLMNGVKVTLKEEIPISPGIKKHAPAEIPKTVKSLQTLKSMGLTQKTIVMVGHRVLGTKISGKNLESDFGEMEKESLKFITREIRDPVWAIFAAPIELPHYGNLIATVGLTKENQLLMLGLYEGKPVDAFKEIIARGVKADKIELGILSFHLDAVDEFKKVFRKANVGLDWQDLEALTVGAAAKAEVREAMLSRDKKHIQQIIKKLKQSKELLTFTEYPEKLWRVLRSTTPISRIQKSLKSKLNKVHDDHERELVLNWELIRLQYHWYKIPVDADQLSNLKFIAAQEREA